MKKKLFEVSATQDAKEGSDYDTVQLLPVTEIMAKDANSAKDQGLLLASKVDGFDVDRVTVIVRPFG